MKWKIFSVCLFWTQHTTRLTTALGGETGWWNRLIFVQQRTFITHSNDDIFPFSYKIESSHSAVSTYSPPPDWWRDQFKFSTFTLHSTRMSALPPSPLRKKGSLLRKFYEINRVIRIQEPDVVIINCSEEFSEYQPEFFSRSIKTSEHLLNIVMHTSVFDILVHFSFCRK